MSFITLQKYFEIKSNSKEIKMDIDGLRYIENFITVEEEQKLLDFINNEEWNTQLKRRTQHYGYIYDYSSKGAFTKTREIPDFFNFLIERLLEQNILLTKPDQLIINEYTAGQGIAPHIDDTKSFDDGIVSLSLGSDIIMQLIKHSVLDKSFDLLNNYEQPEQTYDLFLKRCSVLALFKDARYKWKHGIPARKTDNGVKRNTRVSLTFRKMKSS